MAEGIQLPVVCQDANGREELRPREESEGLYLTTDITEQMLKKAKDGDWSILRKEKYRTMKRISLTDCQMDKIPVALCEFSSLKVLYLSSNKLTKLPPEFKQLRQLTNLNLAANQFTVLPDALCFLKKLEILVLQQNRLTAPGLKKIRELVMPRELHLASNDIEEFPSGICELTTLELLDLRFNRLQEVPDDIKKLEELRVLLLRQNRLYGLPSSISTLKHLKLACFGENCITQVDFDTMFDGLPRIVDLCLFSNRLDSSHNLEENITKFTRRGVLLRVAENRVDISYRITCDNPFEYFRQDVLLVHDGTQEVGDWVQTLKASIGKAHSVKSLGPTDSAEIPPLSVDGTRVVVLVCTRLLVEMIEDEANQQGKALRDAVGKYIKERKLRNFLIIIKESVVNCNTNWADAVNIYCKDYDLEEPLFAEIEKKITQKKGERLRLASHMSTD